LGNGLQNSGKIHLAATQVLPRIRNALASEKGSAKGSKLQLTRKKF
jgi:hypothetical protein